ncbi:hypothetical protein Micbo1qcDRAFT_171779 [Microdochium bolleyi]|uniref:PWI domain-containing protein n=1 Tax=Microdochium bolleyi TaxID=196109 RepID=A0A136JE29_9PEZI|nr:hypothetical protein Micbo1qcDRAFT_171779 [Microdochium bolleyi]
MAASVDAKLLRATKFPPEFNQKVDFQKVNLQVMKKWIASRISEILGAEDDVVTELCFNLIEAGRYPDIKAMQIQLTGFLDKDTAPFCLELWKLCLSAQASPQGVPKELLEAKKQELIQEKLPKNREPDANSRTVVTAIRRTCEIVSAVIAVSEADAETIGAAVAEETEVSMTVEVVSEEAVIAQGLLSDGGAMHTVETATDMCPVAVVEAVLVTGARGRLLAPLHPIQEAQCRDLARGAGLDRVPTANLAAVAAVRGRPHEGSAIGQAGVIELKELAEETHHRRPVPLGPEPAGRPRLQTRDADIPDPQAGQEVHHGAAIGACPADQDRDHQQGRVLQHEGLKMDNNAPLASSSAVAHLVNTVED